ncbi:MAG: thioesterase family protein [Pseudomonadota bacterium]
MQLLEETTVTADEIDSLGHMNVRYYMARMERANHFLLAAAGLGPAELGDTFLRRSDTYTRFQAEQFEGAQLHTVGGILQLDEGGMRSYIEIRNPQTQAVAATFVVTTTLIDRQTRHARPFADVQFSADRIIELPEIARPRSLSLEPIRQSTPMTELDRLLPVADAPGMMHGKRSAQILAEDVDAEGWLREDIELMFLPYMRMVASGNTPKGPPVFKTADGHRAAWAVMETRTLRLEQPRLGEEVNFYSADIRLETKSRLSRRWAYHAASGALLGITDQVGVCIDLDARKAIAWPDEMRAYIAPHLHPQLA